MTLSPAILAHLAMMAFSALVAFSFTFGSLVANDIDPAVITGIRFAIAFAAMALVARALRVSLRFLGRGTWRWMVIGGLMAGYFITMFEALALTTPLATSAVFTLAPLMAAGLGWALLGVRTGWVTLSALCLGGVGALWVIFRGDVDRMLRFEMGYGELLFFFGTIAHAAVPAVTRRLAPNSTSFQAAVGATFGALLVSAAYAIPETLKTDFANLPFRVWMVALYLGIVTTAITFFLIQFAIPRLPPGKVMAYTYLVPSWVVLHAAAVGKHENWPIYIGVAATLIAVAILLLQDTKAGAQP